MRIAYWNEIEIVRRNNEKGFERIKNIVQTKKDTKCQLFNSLIGRRTDYSEDNWYDHNIAYYGTKWDVYYNKIYAGVSDDTIHFHFETVLCPPNRFIKKMCEIYKVDCTNIYSDTWMHSAGCYKVTAYGGYDDERDYYEGLYAFDGESFWGSLGFGFGHQNTDLNEFINSLRVFVTSDDMKEIQRLFEE